MKYLHHGGLATTTDTYENLYNYLSLKAISLSE